MGLGPFLVTKATLKVTFGTTCGVTRDIPPRTWVTSGDKGHPGVALEGQGDTVTWGENLGGGHGEDLGVTCVPPHPTDGVQEERVKAADLSDIVPDTEPETRVSIQGERR